MLHQFASLNLFPAYIKDTTPDSVLLGRWKTWTFIILACIVSALVLRENLEVPLSSLRTNLISSYTDYANLAADVGADALTCECSSNILFQDFAKLVLPPQYDASTNVCQTVYNLVSILTDSTTDCDETNSPACTICMEALNGSTPLTLETPEMMSFWHSGVGRNLYALCQPFSSCSFALQVTVRSASIGRRLLDETAVENAVVAAVSPAVRRLMACTALTRDKSFSQGTVVPQSMVDLQSLAQDPPGCSCFSSNVDLRQNCSFLPNWAASLPPLVQQQIQSISTCNAIRFASEFPTTAFIAELLPSLSVPEVCAAYMTASTATSQKSIQALNAQFLQRYPTVLAAQQQQILTFNRAVLIRRLLYILRAPKLLLSGAPGANALGIWKTRVFIIGSCVVAALVMRENLEVPQTTLQTVPISSLDDYLALTNGGVDMGQTLTCECRNNVFVGDFTQLQIPAQWNISTGACSGILSTVYTLNGALTYEHCTQNERTAECFQCAAALNGSTPCNAASNNTVSFCESGLMYALYSMCQPFKGCFYATEHAIAQTNMGPVLLSQADLTQAIISTVQSNMWQLLSCASVTRDKVLIGSFPPSESFVDAGSLQQSPEGCSCMSPDPLVRYSCSFLPSWAAGLPPELQQQIMLNSSTCDAVSFAAALPTATLSPTFAANMGVPNECLPYITAPNTTAEPSATYFLIDFFNMVQGYWPMNTSQNNPSLIPLTYEDYFAACAPTSCSYLEVTSLTATPWLMIVLCATALHSELALSKLAVNLVGNLLWYVCIQRNRCSRGVCCSRKTNDSNSINKLHYEDEHDQLRDSAES